MFGRTSWKLCNHENMGILLTLSWQLSRPATSFTPPPPGSFPMWMTHSWTTLCPGSLSSTCGPADPYRTSSRTSGSRAGSRVAKTKPTTFFLTSPSASSSWWVGELNRSCSGLWWLMVKGHHRVSAHASRLTQRKYQLDSLLHCCV